MSQTTDSTTTAKQPARARARKGIAAPVTLTWFQGAVLIVGILTLLRMSVVSMTDLNLGPDEAQYWSWSKDFAFGYFSKPPMLAWVIGLTTGVCGDSEACIRMPSPLLHAGTALMLYALGALLFSARTGFWAAIAYATLPAVWFSSGIASTDVPLLFFWSIGLFGLWKTIETKDVRWAAATGAALGLGFMSKYAMVYFLASTLLFVIFDAAARKALLSLRGVVILALGGAIVLPNILWNMQNDFATVSHTAANASWGGSLFHPENMLKFVTDQFGVFGPFLFGALLWILFTLKKRLGDDKTGRAILFLTVFTVPPILVVTVQAFISRANANWAATAYVAATLLVVAILVRSRALGWLKGSIALHSALGLLFYALMLSPALIESLGRGNDFKRVRAWDAIGADVNQRAHEGLNGRPFTAVLVNDRLVYGEMLYYARPLPVPLTMWDSNGIPENHFELNAPLTPALGQHALFVTRSKRPSAVLDRFTRRTELGTHISEIGGGRTRTFTFYAVEGYRPAPPRTEETTP